MNEAPPTNSAMSRTSERRVEAAPEQPAVAAGRGAQAALDQTRRAAAPSCRLSSLVHSAGHRVSETSIEIATAAPSTKPNSVNSRPTWPSTNEIGTNTAIRVSEVAITAKVTWRVPSTPATSGDLAELDAALDVLEHHDRIVHHDADRENQREQREHVDREAERVDADERADHRHGNGDRRHHGRPGRRQEGEDHQDHEHHRDAERVDHLPDRLVDEHRVVGPDRDLHADRQVGSDQVELIAHPVGDRDGVGLRLAQHAEADRLAAVRADDALVVLHAAFDAGDVGKPDRVAVDPLDHDVFELSDVGEPALRAHGELARGRLELRRPAARRCCAAAPARRRRP